MFLKATLRLFGGSGSRLIHTSSYLSAVDKNALSKLRKKTGFPFINCKKALEKFNNDIKEAEVWLREEAQKEGWAKATKLQGRPMSQGLIGIIVDHQKAAMIEVNCETDFVARNPKFLNLVSRAAAMCLVQGQRSGQSKVLFDKSSANAMQSESGEKLSDLVALTVGNIGENMAVRRAVYLAAEEGGHLGSYVHSTGPHVVQDNKCIMGRFGAIASFSQTEQLVKDKLGVNELGRQLCQHVVGMNPTSLGSASDDDMKKDDTSLGSASDGDVKKDDTSLGSASDDDVKKNDTSLGTASDDDIKKDDKRMLHQEFLLEPSLTVAEFLAQNSSTISDFVRFECGEDLGEDQ